MGHSRKMNGFSSLSNLPNFLSLSITDKHVTELDNIEEEFFAVSKYITFDILAFLNNPKHFLLFEDPSRPKCQVPEKWDLGSLDLPFKRDKSMGPYWS